jgi:hypothetical protein
VAKELFAGLPAEVEIRNEARVHVPCAPHGLSEMFNLVVRPNPVLAPREVTRPRQPGGGGGGPN